jgi:hypothetical protein
MQLRFFLLLTLHCIKRKFLPISNDLSTRKQIIDDEVTLIGQSEISIKVVERVS